MSIKKCFTLAEIMVTLGVLGVLAAIAIPAVTKVMPDNNKVMFKKAYSSTEKAVSDLINDSTNYPPTVTVSFGSPPVTLSAGFNDQTSYITGCPTGTSKFCYLLSQDMNTVGTVDCTTNGTFQTSDGVMWTIPLTAFTVDMNTYNSIIVDVNGAKLPNCYESGSGTPVCATNTTPDRYPIGVRFDGKLNVTGTQAIAILTNPIKNQKGP